ncbi:hypothetical protein Btru_034099 [Bulinus truncatus]|nr:hypothetical protein Btru_034099 [Bulinus truncatus]
MFYYEDSDDELVCTHVDRKVSRYQGTRFATFDKATTVTCQACQGSPGHAHPFTPFKPGNEAYGPIMSLDIPRPRKMVTGSNPGDFSMGIKPRRWRELSQVGIKPRRWRELFSNGDQTQKMGGTFSQWGSNPEDRGTFLNGDQTQKLLVSSHCFGYGPEETEIEGPVTPGEEKPRILLMGLEKKWQVINTEGCLPIKSPQ